MKTYVIHVKPGGEQGLEDAVFIKEGFSWYAFLFQAFWALYQRIWWLAGALVGLEIMGIAVNRFQLLPFGYWEAIRLVVILAFSFEATDLYSNSLIKKGYIIESIIKARNENEARLRFLERG